MKNWIYLSKLVLLLVLVSFVSVNAVTISVPAGHATIQGAIDFATSGDSILVSSGTYVENINFLGKHLVVTSIDGRDNTIIQAADSSLAVVSFVSAEPRGTVLSGFTITGGGFSGIYVDSASPSILDNIITNNRSTLSNNGAGICCRNTFATFINGNIIHGNTAETYAAGISIGDDGIQSRSDVVSYNVFYNNIGHGEIRVLGDNINTEITNNTLSVTTSDGVRHEGNGNTFAKNNIVFFAKHDAFTDGAQPGAFYVDYNCTFGNVSNFDFTPGIGNITLDAQFVDTNSNNYYLQLTSPCVDAGDPDTLFYDRDGSRNDMGAFPCDSCEGSSFDDTLINLVLWPVSQGGNDHWYGIIPIVQDWNDHYSLIATLTHNTDPGYLVSITTAEENQFIYDNILVGNTNQPSITDEFYIGGTTTDGWLTGEPMDYTNWASNEPNGDGIAMAIWGASQGSMSGEWNDVPPDDVVGTIHRLWAIVEFGEVTAPPPPVEDSIVNLVQWPVSQGGNDHWYASLQVEHFWEDAKVAAETFEYNNISGHLATVASQEENDFILANVILDMPDSNIGLVNQSWIGGFDTDGYGSWSWVTNEQFQYSNWSLGEPTNVGLETALAMKGNNDPYPGEWNNALPNDSIHSIHQYWSIVEFGIDEDTVVYEDTLINLVQWPVSQGGNDHWYGIIPIVQNWNDHKLLSESYFYDNQSGHMVTIKSAEENQFIFDNILVGNTNQPSITDEFYIGGIKTSGWITGEPMDYTNWANGEPSGDGYGMAIWGASQGAISGLWNDVPQDGSPTSIHRLWSIVEFGVDDSTIGGGGGGDSVTAITLENVIGLSQFGQILDNSDVKFQFRVSNFTDEPILGLFNGFRVYSPDGAEWGSISGDTIGTIGLNMFDLIYKIDGFSVTGNGSDSIVFGGATIFSAGMPSGFSEVSYEISLGYINPIYGGKTICIDSSYTQPAGTWKWVSTSGNIYPEWDGPHCFKIGTIVDPPPTGGDSLIIPTMELASGVNTLTVESKLTQPIKGATIPIAIPSDIEIIDINTTGLITDSWEYNILQVKPDSGFIFVVLANSSGAEIPIGTTGLFNISFIGKNSSCDQALKVHLDTTLSDDVSRRLTFVSSAITPIYPGFDKYRDYLLIPSLRPGDFNNSGIVDVSDLVATVDFMFFGGPPPDHINVLEVNGDCIGPDISDIVKLVDFMFLSGDELSCGCLESTSKKSIEHNKDINIYTEFIDGHTVISVSSPILLKGIELELTNNSQAVLEKVSQNELDLYYSTKDSKTKVGLFDAKGEKIIQSGITKLLTIEGVCDIVTAVVADENARSLSPAINNKSSLLPDQFRLMQNYPNPFNPTTKIAFQLPKPSQVKLIIYNIQGQKLSTLADGHYEAGEHTITWNGDKFSSGVYLYRLETETFTSTKKMMLLK